eukprot:15193832-Alexandrium_andersonii.AAC.1
MSASLVGSEMCIRDSYGLRLAHGLRIAAGLGAGPERRITDSSRTWEDSVSYTHLTLPTICSV